MRKQFKDIMDYGVDLQSRTLYLTGDIDAEMAERVIAAVSLLEKDDPSRPIRVYLCSEGGILSKGWAIYDTFVCSSCEVEIIGTGNVDSMATVVMQAGDTRVMTPYATMFLHNTQISTHGDMDASEIRKLHLDNERENKVYFEAMTKRANAKEADIEMMCEKQTTLTAQEALQWGLIDEILPQEGWAAPEEDSAEDPPEGTLIVHTDQAIPLPGGSNEG